jgi:hypothetical protein
MDKSGRRRTVRLRWGTAGLWIAGFVLLAGNSLAARPWDGPTQFTPIELRRQDHESIAVEGSGLRLEAKTREDGREDRIRPEARESVGRNTADEDDGAGSARRVDDDDADDTDDASDTDGDHRHEEDADDSSENDEDERDADGDGTENDGRDEGPND